MPLTHTSAVQDGAVVRLRNAEDSIAAVLGALEDLDGKLAEAHKTIDKLADDLSDREKLVARHQVEIDRLLVENNSLSARIAELEAEVDGQADREKEDEAKLNS